MIIWVEKKVVVAIHERQVAEHGGPSGIRDERLLESALARPLQLLAYGDPPPDLADLAAVLAFGLVRNHPFVDGNKRTAHVSYRTFLALNGASLSAGDEDKYLAILALAEGKWSAERFAGWLRPQLKMQDGDQVHEPRAVYKVRKPAKKATRRKARG